MKLLLLLVVAVLGLWSAARGVNAAGRQLQQASSTLGLSYDNSKDYMLLGCFPDGGERTIDVLPDTQSGRISADYCAAQARAKSLGVWSTQSSDWCHGGPAANLPAVLTRYRSSKQVYPCESRCSDPNATDVMCGGFFANTVYVWKGKNGYADLGCYVYTTGGHVGSTDVTGSSAAKMTPAECSRLAPAYDFFGLVNGNRCLGFSKLQQAAVAQASGASSCSVSCTGSSSIKCGGQSSMRLYARNKPLPQRAPVTVAPSDYVHLGCFPDQHWDMYSAAEPALTSQILHGERNVDTTYCASTAKWASKRFFATKSTYCMAGSSLVAAVKYSANRATCNSPCASSDLPDRKCGSDDRAMSLYVLKTGKDYTNLGCYALRSDRPPLPKLLLNSPKVNPGFCAKKAAAYKYFALFNGTRCYAGDGLAAALRNGRGSAGCTLPCGNKQTCGGSAAFMMYVNHAWQAPVVLPKPAAAAAAVTPTPVAKTAPTPSPATPTLKLVAPKPVPKPMKPVVLDQLTILVQAASESPNGMAVQELPPTIPDLNNGMAVQELPPTIPDLSSSEGQTSSQAGEPGASVADPAAPISAIEATPDLPSPSTTAEIANIGPGPAIL